ncbi:PIG-L family deacetylase [Thermomicrobium sp. 4228-Ro]|uniref:PIG-L deacetylase family protein n=1 Tax=Thermomicrobium sp. 4228-Ro TaxID=2993937 RepID=UPI002248A136|nr:PIG-L deacetylase family protein [Thermomicrobium sp. 4228-Ro]MCX2726579.1 PIG-L family deacetylase [Thermomicrobium sp. 4228-Ro]
MEKLSVRHIGEPPLAERVLIVGAHPDDPEFFCAGTVARWVAAGTTVHYVVVTSGDKGQPEHWNPSRSFVEVREAEQLAAAQLLGVQGITFLRLPDGEVFDTLALRAQLTAEIRRFRPDIVLTHDPLTRLYRQHPDHRAVGAATLAAAFPASRLATFFPEQLAAGLHPHVVRVALLFGSDRPDTFVDIAPVLERKLAALRCHTSQASAFPGGTENRVRSRAREAGAPVGLEYAEAFLWVDLE